MPPSEGAPDNAVRVDHPGSGPSTDENEADGWIEVAFSLPWTVTRAKSGQDAINIAVSEVGKRVNQSSKRIRKTDISVQSIGCPDCSATSDALLLVSNTALVGLTLTTEVQATSPEDADRLARRELGPLLPETPLTTIDVDRFTR